jgi:hypothetical protein
MDGAIEWCKSSRSKGQEGLDMGDGGGAFRKTRYTEASEVGKPCRRFHEILGCWDWAGDGYGVIRRGLYHCGNSASEDIGFPRNGRATRAIRPGCA